jgi:hypothetical protein
MFPTEILSLFTLSTLFSSYRVLVPYFIILHGSPALGICSFNQRTHKTLVSGLWTCKHKRLTFPNGGTCVYGYCSGAITFRIAAHFSRVSRSYTSLLALLHQSLCCLWRKTHVAGNDCCSIVLITRPCRCVGVRSGATCGRLLVWSPKLRNELSYS